MGAIAHSAARRTKCSRVVRTSLSPPAVPGSGTYRLDAAKVVLPKKAALRAGAGAAVRDAATGAELPTTTHVQHTVP